VGLGLTICKMLAQRLGGSISFSSTYGVGTTFSFTIDFEPCLEGPLSNEISTTSAQLDVPQSIGLPRHLWPPLEDASPDLDSQPTLTDRPLISERTSILIVDDIDFNLFTLSSII